MRRISVFIPLLVFISVSRCQEGTVQYTEAEQAAVVVVVSGTVGNFEGKAFDSPLFDIAVSNDDSFNLVQILGRRVGPFDGPVQDNFNFGNQILSLLNSRLRALEDLQSQITTAMALRCPRMRQRALENILVGQYYTIIPQEDRAFIEPGVIHVATTTDKGTDTFSSSSSSGKWLPGIIANADITAEEPDFSNRIKEKPIDMNDIMKREDDVLYFDSEVDEDSDDNPSRDVPMEMPLSFPLHHHHHHHHGHNHDHSHFIQEHAHMEHHGHFHDQEEKIRPGGGGGGFKTKPLPFNPFDKKYDGHAHHSRQSLPLPDSIFSATMYTDFIDDGIEGADFNGMTRPYIGINEKREDESDQFVNLELWNQDGSLNTGFFLFLVLCGACAVVWCALLMQCASMGYAWATCCSTTTSGDGSTRGQFMFLAPPSESGSDGEDEDEKDGELKGWKKQKNSVVIAAKYIKC